jgi:hypothetical protein
LLCHLFWAASSRSCRWRPSSRWQEFHVGIKNVRHSYAKLDENSGFPSGGANEKSIFTAEFIRAAAG